ncbi:MAG: hypothetical protein KKB65_01760 [Nanoarchaeota archaeon]|nr:hypothetical protein [Nanoarchaeota archaeon]
MKKFLPYIVLLFLVLLLFNYVANNFFQSYDEKVEDKAYFKLFGMRVFPKFFVEYGDVKSYRGDYEDLCKWYMLKCSWNYENKPLDNWALNKDGCRQEGDWIVC